MYGELILSSERRYVTRHPGHRVVGYALGNVTQMALFYDINVNECCVTKVAPRLNPFIKLLFLKCWSPRVNRPNLDDTALLIDNVYCRLALL